MFVMSSYSFFEKMRLSLCRSIINQSATKAEDALSEDKELAA